MGYSEEQKKLVLAILEDNRVANADDLYAVLRPRKSTIKKWIEGDAKTATKKAHQFFDAIKDRPSLVPWIIFEGFLVFLIVVASIMSLELAIILVDSFIPQQDDMERMGAILTSSYSFLRFELLLAFAAVIFSMMFNILGREKRWMKNTGIALAVSLIVVIIGNVITVLVRIATDANLFLLLSAAVFCCTIVFVSFLYANGCSKGAEHDGYGQSLRLITILSLVTTILLALFSLVEGDCFSEKACWLIRSLRN